MTLPREYILGYRINTSGVAESITSLIASISNNDGTPRWLACFNPHSYAIALKDDQFSRGLRCSDWLVPDGTGVVFASWFLNGAIRKRVTGSDLFIGVHEQLNSLGGSSVFYLGSSEATLTKMCEKTRKEYPNVRIAGCLSPPFKDSFSPQETSAMIAMINTAAPDVLWVGMTAPKQEKWLFENVANLNIRFAAAVGAVFDFYSGRINRSHPIFQNLGLEWLPRLLQEPRRLWPRMFVSAPVFVWHVLRYGRRGKPSRSGDTESCLDERH